MKSSILSFFVCLLIIVSENIFAQTASDYYQSLSAGNQLILHTTNYNSTTGWGSRSTIFTIASPEMVNGKLYYKEIGTEIMDAGGTNIFHVFWLRKDSVGNIFMHAYCDSLLILDSAIVVNGNIFPNEFLTKGYSRANNVENYIQKDSVVSVSETVVTPAGTFNNCLEISESQIDSSGIITFQEYHYYAYGIGMIKNVRAVPASDAHVDVLISFVLTGVKNESNSLPKEYSLGQNYPNPFNPSTMINYTIPNAAFVQIKLYDVLGREVETLVGENKSAGSYSVIFNADKLVSGVYFYRMEAGNYSETKKLILTK